MVCFCCMIGTIKGRFIKSLVLRATFLYTTSSVNLKIMHIYIKHWKMYPYFFSCIRQGMDFGLNSVLGNITFITAGGSQCIPYFLK